MILASKYHQSYTLTVADEFFLQILSSVNSLLFKYQTTNFVHMDNAVYQPTKTFCIYWKMFPKWKTPTILLMIDQ